MQCYACKSEHCTEFLGTEKLPLIAYPVKEAVKDDIFEKDIQSYHCQECNHVFTDRLKPSDLELLYGNYYKFYPYDNLETMIPFYREPFDNFFRKNFARYGSSQKKPTLLEIGCSSVDNLKHFEDLGLESYGIDPSPLSNPDGGRIISSLYEHHKFSKRFKVIISRFNLEHLNDIHVFFEKLRDDLSDDGLVFIQVPNIEEYANNLIPTFLAHEHIQYFNAHSLAASASLHGFSVLDTENEGKQSILIVLKKNDSSATEKGLPKVNSHFFEEYLDKLNLLKEDVRNFLANRSNVCFYGSGMTLSWILYYLNYRENRAGIVIDDNPVIGGLFMPGTDFKLVPFDKQTLSSSESILLTLNPAYHDVVLSKIKNSDYNNDIYSIGRSGLVMLS